MGLMPHFKIRLLIQYGDTVIDVSCISLSTSGAGIKFFDIEGHMVFDMRSPVRFDLEIGKFGLLVEDTCNLSRNSKNRQAVAPIGRHINVKDAVAYPLFFGKFLTDFCVLGHWNYPL